MEERALHAGVEQDPRRAIECDAFPHASQVEPEPRIAEADRACVGVELHSPKSRWRCHAWIKGPAGGFVEEPAARKRLPEVRGDLGPARRGLAVQLGEFGVGKES